MKTSVAWVTSFALMCWVLITCSFNYEAKSPLISTVVLTAVPNTSIAFEDSTASESVSIQSLVKDFQDPDVRRSMRSFRREYKLTLVNIKDSPRADVEEVLRGIYEKYVDTVGVNGILNFLEASLCHSEGHPVGKIIYSRLKDLKKSIHLAGRRCTNAVYHGVLMEAFATGSEHLDLNLIEDEINRICIMTEGTELFNMGNCAHGVGHAVMFLSGFDIDYSMQVCKRLTQPALQYYCASGAFMEYDGVYGREDIAKSLHYPCDTLTEFAAACYRYKMHWTVPEMILKGHEIEDIAKECMGLDRMRRLGCFHGMGVAFLFQIAQSPDKIRTICGFGYSDDQRMCIEGVIGNMADSEEDLAFHLCGYFNSNNRLVCEKAAKDHEFNLDKDFSLYIGDSG